MTFHDIYFIHHTRGPHHGRSYAYPHDPGYGYWVHDAHTGGALDGPFATLREARKARREMLGLEPYEAAAAAAPSRRTP